MRTSQYMILSVALLSPACVDDSSGDPVLAEPAVGEAQALASGTVTCTGTEVTTYTPGLLLTPQSVARQTNGVYGPCISSDPTLTSGLTATASTTTRSCLNALGPASGTLTFSWNNGNTSTYTFNELISDVGGQLVVTSTGVVTAGQFQGATVVRVITGPSINLLGCLAPPGITSRFNAVVLEIL